MASRSETNGDTNSNQVLVEEKNFTRTIILNRPRQLNALSSQMVSRLLELFSAYEDDSNVKLVIVKGQGRAFSAGGDVSAVVHDVTQGNWRSGAKYFWDEFSLNYRMATYSKPQLSILNGIVMGGGAGASIHGRFRVATENSMFAMPETALGLFPDVGASYFLSRLPGFYGEYVGLTGARLDGAEMLECGLATHFVLAARLSLLEEALVEVNTSDPVVISAIIDKFSQQPLLKEKSALHRLDIIDRCFARRTVEDILSALEREALSSNDGWISAAIQSWKNASPMSLKISLRSDDVTQLRHESLKLLQLNYMSEDEEDRREMENSIVCQNMSDVIDTTDEFNTIEIFKSSKDLVDWCKEVGKSIGVVIIIQRSDSYESGRRPRVNLSCEKSGVFRPKKSKTINPPDISKKRPRNVGSKKCGCPFQLKGCQRNDGRWELTVVCGTHNHVLADNLIGHAFPARLTSDEQRVVIELTEAGGKPREMLTVLKKRNANNLSTLSTIYNFRAKHRLTKFQGRSQMQQLFKNLDDHGYFVDHKMNLMTKECTSIFFARPESVELAKCFPEVLIMDCTYKTNMHNLPLLDIVGFTSTMKTFAVAFAYLENEKEDSFVWALERLYSVLKGKSSSVGVIMTDRDLALMNAVARVFPQAKHLLCRWHIQTNVIANCKKAFKKNKDFEEFYDDVNDLFDSTTENVYNHRLEKFRKKHKKGVVQYVEEQWLKRYKERFVAAWTNSIMHFNTHTSNRAESMHSSLKRHLGSSRGNLSQNWEVINNLLANQLTVIQATFNMSRNIVRHHFIQNEYSEIRGFISREAMEMIAKELQQADFIVNKEMCGCVLRRTCGLPCAHELRQVVNHGNGIIPLSLIHARWRKLDNVPMELPAGSLDILPEIEGIKKKFDSLPDNQKFFLMQKCLELADPKTTFMLEPERKLESKGRPQNSYKSLKRPNKVENDTKRDPSAFEYAQTEEEMQAAEKNQGKALKKVGRPPKKQGADASKQNQSKAKKRPFVVVPVLKNIPGEYDFKWNDDLSELNPNIRDFIEFCSQVPGDGHCGYRSIAKIIGLDDDSGWKIVREKLFVELTERENEYERLMGSSRVELLRKNLLCRKPTTMNEDEWFDLPDMGWLTASAYNCVFITLAPNQQITYLPLWTPPVSNEIKVITIAHIWDGRHYVPLRLTADAPFPMLIPGWQEVRDPVAAPWLTLVEEKIGLWNELFPKFGRGFANVYKKKLRAEVVDLEKKCIGS